MTKSILLNSKYYFLYVFCVFFHTRTRASIEGMIDTRIGTFFAI